jgi:hypothetical protein
MVCVRMSVLSRRAFLTCTAAPAAAAWITGCGAAPPPPSRPAGPPPIEIENATHLLALAGLRWLILCRPRDIVSVPWLLSPISTFAPEHRFLRFAESTGMDLRQVREAAIGVYATESGDSSFYLVRHGGDAQTIERAFRRRLTGGMRRSVLESGITLVSGTIGASTHVLVVIGRDIAGFQQGGSLSRGPARIAALYAEGKLKRSPTVLAEEPLRSLDARFGDAPFRAFARGPFEGELARGIRGLLAGATAAGIAARPSVREGILVAIAITGDFSTSADAASQALLSEWTRISESSFGHLLGLDQPADRPLPTHGDGAIALAVELDPKKLAAGLAAATMSQVEDIMK